MAKTYLWTVDVETDWGGRTSTTQGLEEGLPFILETFRAYKVRGLFFVSTELLRDHASLIKNIKDHGHEIGSHGHFHVVYACPVRRVQDREISMSLLKSYRLADDPKYRGPKFCLEEEGNPYSTRANHCGLIRSTFGIDKHQSGNIIYMHPFDIVEPKTKAPNLFCKLWYSRPKKAKVMLENLLTS